MLVIMVVGFITVGLALYAEVAFGIPTWLHFLLWPTLAVAISLPLLRGLKGAMIGQQFARSAAEGRIAMRADALRGRGEQSGQRGQGDMPRESPRDESDPVA